MKYFNQFVSRVCESQKGQTMTEYVLIIAAIRGSRLPRVPGYSKAESTRLSPTLPRPCRVREKEPAIPRDLMMSRVSGGDQVPRRSNSDRGAKGTSEGSSERNPGRAGERVNGSRSRKRKGA